jgi:hypothetical protein
MGQQQLLLLVLGIVIVGIAIVVGINAYAENSVKANYDALLQDGLRIVSDAQSWKSKPELFGGQFDSLKADQLDFSGANFASWGYSEASVGDGGACYVNLNGVFEIATADDTGLLLTGASAQHINQIQLYVNGILEPNVTLGTDSDGSSNAEGELVLGGADVTTGTPQTVTVTDTCDPNT